MSNSVKAKAYSNIAFIKYWGKYGRQYPMNPSISMLIPQCYSECEITFKESSNNGIKEFLFEDKINEDFKTRFQTYFDNVSDIIPFVNKYEFSIKTSNNFPHSAGIASSASAFAALAKCLVKIDNQLNDNQYDQNKASILARLGSGSACRSLSESEFTLWGETRFEIGSNDFTTDLDIDDSTLKDFGWPLLDTILVVSSDKKEVSSSKGHQLMNSSIYKDARIEHAHENTRTLYQAIKNADFELFGEIIENEAMTLHALMMSSYPSFCLLHPASLDIINEIKKFRSITKTPVYFTIDAGPNIHLIYREQDRVEVTKFINNILGNFCENIIWANENKSE